jgi:hypothetical protein
MKRSLVSMALMLLVMLIGNCGDEGTGPSDDGADYLFPLAAGNWWAFESDPFESEIVRKDTMSVLTREVHSSNRIKYVIRHVTFFEGSEWSNKDTLTVWRWGKHLVAQQFWTTVCADPTVERFICFLKEPLVPGDFWISVGDTFVAGAVCTLDVPAETTYVLGSSPLSVPAESFVSAICTKQSIDWTFMPTGTYSWWVEGVGRVMFAWCDEAEETTYCRLVGYGVSKEAP